ncbi:hypothetical protein HDV02_000108 [Globomyces sp. JEL0801]|nr:hypothetical protein HDV02_000108 [Globomyces sp. JEL0801]
METKSEYFESSFNTSHPFEGRIIRKRRFAKGGFSVILKTKHNRSQSFDDITCHRLHKLRNSYEIQKQKKQQPKPQKSIAHNTSDECIQYFEQWTKENEIPTKFEGVCLNEILTYNTKNMSFEWQAPENHMEIDEKVKFEDLHFPSILSTDVCVTGSGDGQEEAETTVAIQDNQSSSIDRTPESYDDIAKIVSLSRTHSTKFYDFLENDRDSNNDISYEMTDSVVPNV